MVGSIMLLKMLHCKRLKKKKASTKEDDSEGPSRSIPSEVSVKKEKGEYDERVSMCRVCLKEGNISIYGNDGFEDVSEALMTISGIDMTYEDAFPKYLCEECNSLLHGAILFRKTAQQTDELLRQPPPNLSDNEDDDMLDEGDMEFDYQVEKDEYEEEKDKKKDYHCKICKNEKNYNCKRDRAKGRSYSCKKCALNFETFEEYGNHRLSEEHENMKATCPICKNKYAPMYLKKHIALHKKESSHMCDICGKKFIIQGQFARHRLTHFYDLPFQCTLCPYKGRFSESLKLHMRTHTGEKPYQCTECPSRFFVNKSNLNKHMLTHKQDHDHKCSLCQRGFYSKRELDLHFKVDHSGIKDHICNVCGKAFGYRKQMMKHQRKVHKRDKLRSGRTPLYILAELKKQDGES